MGKLIVLRHLRPDVQGAKAETLGPLYWRRHANQSASYDVKRSMTSVYFENEEGQQYASRRRRRVGTNGKDSGPAPFRCRWIGENSGDKDFEVHVDIEPAAADGEVADVPLAQREMQNFVDGSLGAEAMASKYGHNSTQTEALAKSIQGIKSAGLKPCLSASFSRTSFVHIDKASIGHATIDEELVFRDEAKSQGNIAWCLAATGKGSTVDGIPGAILRVQVGEKGAMAPLVYALEALDLRSVPGFSKALHGTALLRRSIAVPLPPWCPGGADKGVIQEGEGSDASKGQALTEEIPKVATPAKATKGGDKQSVAATEKSGFRARLRACWAKIDSSTVEVAGKARELRVDSKTPMANERTLLRWKKERR